MKNYIVYFKKVTVGLMQMGVGSMCVVAFDIAEWKVVDVDAP